MTLDSPVDSTNSLSSFSNNFNAFLTIPDAYNLTGTFGDVVPLSLNPTSLFPIETLNPTNHTPIPLSFSVSKGENSDPAVSLTKDPLTGQAAFAAFNISSSLSNPTTALGNFVQSQQFTNTIPTLIDQLFFVDTSIADYQRWLEVASQTSKVVFLNGNDELGQITQTLAQYHNISAIHLVTHGADGEIFLGNTVLNSDTLANYASSFQSWKTALSPGADILLYGCDVAEGTTGQAFVNQLSVLTGADVAASDDLTGDTKLGGDWTLEYQTGAIEHQTLAIQNYHSTLGLAEVSVSADGVLTFKDKTSDLIPNGIGVNDLINTVVSLTQVNQSYDFISDKINLNPANDLEISLDMIGELYIKDKNSDIVFQKVENSPNNNAITRVSANEVKINLKSISKVDINTDESQSDIFKGLNIISSVANDKITFMSDFSSLSKSLNFSIDGGIGTDTVVFNNGLFTQGGNLDVKAEKITVKEGVTISTQQNSGNSGSITFSGAEIYIQNKAKIIASATKESDKSGDLKFLAVDERTIGDFITGFGTGFTTNVAKITIGEKAVLEGQDITLDAQAQGLPVKDATTDIVKDIYKNFSNLTNYSGGVTRFLTDFLADIPFAFKGQKSEAIIDLSKNSQIKSQGQVKISSKATANNNLSVVTKDGASITEQLSIALAWSEATAKTLVGEEAKISADGNVEITSDATTIADTTARVSRNLGLEVTDNQSRAVSIAAAYTKATSNAIIAKNADIDSKQNVNISALGTNNNATAAQTGSYKDGQFGLTVSVGVADSDIRTEINGKITATGAGQSLYTFDPNSAVDVDKDTINLGKASKWQTGDRIIYRNHDSNDLYSTNRSIGNLVDGKTYYTIVDSNKPNVVKLAETLEDAKKGEAINLKVIQFGDLGTGHQLEQETTSGIGIFAKLTTQEKNKAEVGIGGGSLLDKVLDIASGKTEVLTSAIRASETLKEVAQKVPGLNKFTDKIFPVKSGPSNANSNWSVAGSFALGSTDHKVQAIIGSTAVLKSGQNLDVKAEQIDVPAMGAASGIEKKEGANKDTAVSVAVSLGLYKNTVQAVVQGGARLDAKQATNIQSKTYYPLIFDQFSNFNITYPNEAAKKVRENRSTQAGQYGFVHPYAGLLLDLAGLVESKAFPSFDFSTPGAKTPWNSWTKASSDSDKLGIAGSINFFKFDNTTETVINSGAEINQDSSYRTDNQSVNVKALTTGTFINVTGNPFKPVGGANDNGGVGGSIYGSLFTNTTIAKIDSGVLINTGVNAGLTVDATSKLTSVNFVYSGGRGKTFAVNGTVAVNLYDSLTMAQVASGAKVTGGFLTVNALDDTNYWNVVGGALQGENTGIGASVAITDMDRNTFALIGVPDVKTSEVLSSSKFNRPPAAVTPGQTLLDLKGALKVQAKNDGDNFDISLAASIVYSSNTVAEKAGDIQKQASGIGDDVLAGQSIPSQAQAPNSNGKISNNQGNQGQFGLGISGDVSIHTITDNVFAYINDFSANNTKDSITASQIDVNSNNDTNFFSLAGSVAFASSEQGSSVGIAGSFAKNSLNGATRAYIANNILNINKTFAPSDAVNFDQDTINLGNHQFLTGDAVVYRKTEGFFNSAIGGLNDGQTYYVIVDPNQKQFIKLAASLDDAKAGKAIDLSKFLFSIFGNGNKLEQNYDNFKLAIRTTTGQLAVNANNRARIIAITAGGSGAPKENGVVVAGSVSLNFLDYQTDAFIDRTKSTVLSTNTSVNAKDESNIFAVAGSLGLGGKAGVGASIAFNKVNNSVTATLNRSDLTQLIGQINLTATNNAQIRGYVGSVGVSKDQQGLGAAGTIAVNLITGKTDAAWLDLTSQGGQGLPDITISAEDTSFIQSVAGAVGASSANGLGAAVAYNNSDRTTTARVEGSQTRIDTVNQLTLNAKAKSNIESLSLGVGGGKDVGLAGSASINVIKNGVDAHIKDVSATNQPNSIVVENLNLQAQDESKIQSLAGGVSGGKEAAIGAAIAVNQIGDNNKGVQAYIDNSVIKTNGSATLKATFTGDIGTIAVGGSGANNFALGGSVAYNIINNPVLASIRNQSQVTAEQTISLEATDNSTINAAGGGIAGAGQTAIGAAVVKNLIGQGNSLGVQAVINNATVTSNKAKITLNAQSSVKIKTTGVGGSGAESFALGGSVVLNDIALPVAAFISNQAKVTARASVILSATQNSNISVIAGGAAGSGNGAVGAALATNKISGNGVQAYIDKSTVESTSRGVEVSATVSGEIKAIGAGGAGSGNLAAGASIVLNEIALPVAGYISDSTVTANDNILLSATQNNSISVIAGGAAGAGNSAAGVAVATNKIRGNGVQAYINKGSIESKSGKVQVSATASGEIKAIGVGGSGAGNTALAGSAVLNEIALPVAAYIADAKVTANSDIVLSATQNSNISVISGGGSGAGGAAFGAAVATNKISGNGVQAYINKGTVESKSGQVQVSATASGEIKAIGVGGAGAGGFALGGSVVLNEIALPVTAYIADATVTASSNIFLSASQNSTISAFSGGVAGAGGSAVGAALATNKISGNGVQAYINNATVESKSSRVELIASSSGKINALGLGGAFAGTFAAGGSVILNEINLPVAAYITNQAKVTADQGVKLNAIENTEISAKAGGVAVSGTGAVGAALATNKIGGNGVQAYIDGGTVSSKSYLFVSAQSTAKIEALTLGGAGDTVASVGGSVSLNEISNPVTARIDGNAKIEVGGEIFVRSKNDATIIAKAGGAALSGGVGVGAAVTTNKINRITKAFVDGTSSLKAGSFIEINAQGTSNLESLAIGAGLAAAVGLGASVSKNEVNGTVKAYVANSAKIEANSSLSIIAKQTTKFDGIAGGFAGSLGGALGGAYTSNTVTTTTQAYVDGTARLTVGGLTVEAESIVQSGKVEAYAGGAGAVAGAAAYIDLKSKNNTTAYIGSNVDIVKANSVYVYATSDSTLKSSAIGGAIGAGAAGIIQVNLSETGTTEAYLGNGIKIGSSTDSNQRPSNLVVRAIANNTLEGDTTGATAGVASGSGSLTNITATPTVKAWIGDNAKIYLSEDAVIRAFANGSVQGKAWGANIAGLFSGGQSTTTVEWKPTIEATIGQGSVLDVAGKIDLGSFNNFDSKGSNFTTPNVNDQAKVAATATSSNGSLGGTVTGASATTTINVNQKTEVKDNVQLKARRNIDLLAYSYNPIDANATGGSSGILAKGSAEAKVDITNNVTVATLANVQLDSTSDNISLRSTSNNRSKDNDDNTVIAKGGAAGLVASAGTNATIKENNRTSTTLGQNNRIIAAGAIVIDADHIADFKAKSEQKIDKGVVSNNNSLAEIKIDSVAKTDIGSNAQVEGNKITVQAQDSSSDFFAKADAITSSVTADTYATARILTPNLDAKVNVGSNSIFKAPTDVTIQARQSDVRSDTNAYAKLDGFPSNYFKDILGNLTPPWPWENPPKPRPVSLGATAYNDQLTYAILNFGSGVQVISRYLNYSANTNINKYDRTAQTAGLAGVLGNKIQSGSDKKNQSVSGKPEYTKWLLVDKEGDENNGNYNPGDFTLLEAIQATSTSVPNLITFANSIQQIQLTREISSMTTTQPVTIDGGTQQVEIKGSSQNRIFSLPSGQNLTLKNLFLTGGRADNGGLIRNQGNLNIINSVLRGGNATNDGGAIFNDYRGNLNLVNSVVTDNKASKKGGAIYSKGSLSLANSVIDDNLSSSQGWIGGIVWNYQPQDDSYNSPPSLSIVNSTISRNRSDGSSTRGYDAIEINIGQSNIPYWINNQQIKNSYISRERANINITNNIIFGNIYIRDYSESGSHIINLESNLVVFNGARSNLQNVSENNRVFGDPDPLLDYIQVQKLGTTFYVPTLNNPNSPAVNKGNNAYVPKDTFDLDGDRNTSEPIPVDQRGRQRIYDGKVDIGAQEYQPVTSNATQASAAPTTARLATPLAVEPLALAAPTVAEAIEAQSLKALAAPTEKVLVAPVAQIPLERGDTFEIDNVASDNDEDIFGFSQLPSQGVIEFTIDGETRKITGSLSDANPDLISNADLLRGELLYIHNSSAKNDSFEILNTTKETPAHFDINIENTAPIFSSPINEQIAIENKEFVFTLSKDTFYDADWEVDDKLTYKAELSDGTSLPEWLKFNTEEGVFSGTPSDRDLNLLEIQVTATDESGATASGKFSLRIDHNYLLDQQIRPNTPFTYHFDAEPSFTYTATLDDGSPLPSWLNFDPQTHTFTGTPTSADVGVKYVKVTATDNEGFELNDIFTLEVANWIVDNATDESDGNVSPGDLSLREAIELAQNGDTIAFAPNLSRQVINLTQGEILINKSLTISGQGEFATIISGNEQNRIFTIDDGNATQQSRVDIFGIALTGGKVTDNGGAIWNKENLTITNTTLNRNQAGNFGGAIWNDQGTIAIENSGIYENTATQAGGAIANSGTLSLNLTDIDRNTTTGKGGGVYNTSIFTSYSSTINDNIAGAYISIENGKPRFELDNTGTGGGVFSEGGKVTIIDGEMNHNASALFGGAIAMNQGQLIVENSGILKNIAQTGAGISIINGNANIVNSTITLNESTNQGGGIYGDRANINLFNSTVVYNSSINDSPTTNGAGIHLQGGQLLLANSILAKNTTTSIGGTPITTDVVSQNQAQIIALGGNIVEDGSVTGNGVLNVDPQLASLQEINHAWVYPLLFNSPGKDGGENGLRPADLGDIDRDGNTSEPILVDQRGSDRLSGNKIDLGAYEIQQPQATAKEDVINNWVRGDIFTIDNLGTDDADLYSLFKLPEQGELTFTLDDEVTQTLTQTFDSNNPVLLRGIDLRYGTLEYTHNGTSKDGSVELINLKDGSITRLVFSLINNAPEVVQAISDETIYEQEDFTIEIPRNTFTDADIFLNDDVSQGDIDPEDRADDDNTGAPISDSLTYSATLANGSPLPKWLTFDPSELRFFGKADFVDIGTLEIRITATDERNAQTSTTFRLIVNQTTPTLERSAPVTNILQQKGDLENSSLQFTLTGKNVPGKVINEVGFFVVDDAQGRIGELLPNSPGYLLIALQRAKVIFSVLPDNFIPNPTRILENITEQFLSFYLIQDGSTDDVINDPIQADKVLFGSNQDGASVLQVSTININTLQLTFNDQLANSQENITLTVSQNDSKAPIGTSLQGQHEREIVDLRDYFGQTLTASFPIIKSEAAFNNTVGFYRIENSEGTVIDPTTNQSFNPGDTDYTLAAIRNSQVYGISFDRHSQDVSAKWQGGYLYVPYMIANGTIAELLDTNRNNDQPVYFVYSQANPDKIDHIRLLGDNTWGFEDLMGGGDLDFNDMVIYLSFQDTELSFDPVSTVSEISSKSKQDSEPLAQTTIIPIQDDQDSDSNTLFKPRVNYLSSETNDELLPEKLRKSNVVVR